MAESSAATGDRCGGEADLSPELFAYIDRANRSGSDQDPDPFQRIGGTLEIYCSVDLKQRRVTEAASVATRFRGYEALLARRGLRDAGLVSSSASGICGGVHATASSLCLEMALGVKPPPMGIVARNLLLSCQYLNDNPMHLFVLSGPDYSQEAFLRTNPEIWEKAQQAPAHHASVHGYTTVGAIMRQLNRGTGELFQEALRMASCARAAYTILGGKFPHSESIVCGGVKLDLSAEKLEAFERKLVPFVDYAKRCARIWDDVFDFLYEANSEYRHVGEGPANMVDFGQWDHEEFYDASYQRSDAWGQQRWSTPGAVIDGELVTTRLTELNRGLEDSIARSFYDDAEPQGEEVDPLGVDLGRHHPWNKRPTANPEAERLPRPYSWASAMTWRGRTFEVGAYARLYISALAGRTPASEFLESTGDRMLFHLPPGGDGLPADSLQWRVPPVWNAFERNRARGYAVAFNLTVTLENVRRARALMAKGDFSLVTPFEIPSQGRQLGAGFCGAGRGFLAHWAVIENGSFSNYRIAVPSRINAGPRSASGELGALERALADTPVLESSFRAEEDLEGIDIIRAIQSFDPCMTCSAHIRIENSAALLDRVVTTSGP